MSGKRIIPITPLMGRYMRLRSMSQEQRLAEARRSLDDPAEFAEEFAATVAHFASYDNRDQHFYDEAERPRREAAEEVVRTNDVVLHLPHAGVVYPKDAPGRPGVRKEANAVPAEKLAFEYVDRELLVQRTQSPAEWEDGRHNRGGVRLDVLLANAHDRTPIVGEVKVRRDMDPYFALVQALTAAAHLVTLHQYERMRRHLPRGKFPELAEAPRLDVYLLLVESSTTGRFMGDLAKAAQDLAALLVSRHELAPYVRYIAAMDLSAERTGVSASVRWAWWRRHHGEPELTDALHDALAERRAPEGGPVSPPVSEIDELRRRSDELGDQLGSDEALEVNAALLDLDPGDARTTNRLGIGLLKHHQAQEAKLVFEQGLRLHPDDEIMARRLHEAEKMIAGPAGPTGGGRGSTHGRSHAGVGWADFEPAELVESSLAGPGRDASIRLCAASIRASEAIDPQWTAVTPIKNGRRFRTIGGIFTGVGPWKHLLTVAVPVARKSVIAAAVEAGAVMFEPAKAVPCVQVGVPRAAVEDLYDELLGAHVEHLKLSLAAGPPTHLNKHNPALRQYILDQADRLG